MRITIPDALADVYDAHARRANVALDEIITRQLRSTAGVSPMGRTVVLGIHTLELLEERLGGGPLVDSADLAQRFTRLASISFEGIDLKLTPNQLAELQRRATRQGKTPAQLIEAIAQVICRDFFDVPDAGPVATPRVEASVPIPGLANAPAR